METKVESAAPSKRRTSPKTKNVTPKKEETSKGKTATKKEKAPPPQKANQKSLFSFFGGRK